MADLSKVTGKDGQINNEALLAALKQVLDNFHVPMFKALTEVLPGMITI